MVVPGGTFFLVGSQQGFYPVASLVGKRGLEPPPPEGDQPLKLARLPIPPLALSAGILADLAGRASFFYNVWVILIFLT